VLVAAGVLAGGVVGAGAGIVAAPAHAAVPGHQVISAVSSADSSSPKTVTATCPSGKRVVGTGVYVDGAPGAVTVSEIVPNKTSVRVTGYEDQTGTSATWWIRAFAVCADPLPGLTIVSATSAATSDGKAVTATCPAGTATLGVGAAVAGGKGEVFLDAMLPLADAGYAEAYEDPDGARATWTLTAYTICATAPAGWQLVTSHTPTDSLDKVDAPACPAAAVPLGPGWDVKSNVGGGIGVDVAMPTGTGALVAAREHGTVTDPWTLTTRVVCATP
jgi:hypothetical protein